MRPPGLAPAAPPITAPAGGAGGRAARGRGGTGFSQSEITPIVVKGVMHITTPYGQVVALDATTGKEIWTHASQGSTRGDGAGGASSPPLIYKNIIISQSANPNHDGRAGDIRAFDVMTGRQLWRFATIPDRSRGAA